MTNLNRTQTVCVTRNHVDIMPQEDLQELEADILRRLKAVDVTSSTVEETVVARTLEKYLAALGFSPRPIRWARDGQQAQDLVARSDLSSVTEELSFSIDRVVGRSVQREQKVWTDARDAAKAAGHGGPLDVVKGLLRGYSVRLSVPWRFYERSLTGDRGARTSPEDSRTWKAAADALEYAARAGAECAWALTARSQNGEHGRYEDVWLPFVDAYEAGLWLFWIAPAEVIALPRPRLQLSAEQPHAAKGPAVSWVDGEEQYFFLNGVHVPREIVETPARELDPRLLLRERNSEVRREIVRKIGIERVCEALEAHCLDRQGDYELLLLDLGDWRKRPFLKMKNPSIGVYHIEGVAPDCRTVAEALAWRNQSDIPPSVLT